MMGTQSMMGKQSMVGKQSIVGTQSMMGKQSMVARACNSSAEGGKHCTPRLTSQLAWPILQVPDQEETLVWKKQNKTVSES